MALTDAQRARLLHLLGNELDMCFRRRALVLYDYLDLRDDDRMLDCGCGRGFFLNMTRELSQCTLVGIDSEAGVLETAQEELGRRGKEVWLCKSLAAPLPFPDACFDKILFTEVLEHVPDDRLVLAELYRVLKPGGVMALSVPNDRYPFLWDPINRVLQDLFNRPIREGVLSGIWANHERLYKVEDLRDVVQHAGFQVLQEDLITYFCFPFAHNLVYGLGKELLLAGKLPGFLSSAADRFSYDENRGSALNPINLMRALFLKIDALNERIPPRRSSVIIAMKLQKPSAPT